MPSTPARLHPAALIALGTLVASSGAVADGNDLDTLLDQYRADAPPAQGSVRLDGWVQGEGEAQRLVVVLEPEGETKLVADPGITLTPVAMPGVRYEEPLPHRTFDPSRDYLDAPATVELRVSGLDGAPVDVTVEYAYCLVNWQCFFGEETLTLTRVD